MDRQTIVEKLERLAVIQDAKFNLERDCEEKRAAILAVVSSQLADLDAEYGPTMQRAAENVAILEGEIKAATIELGESVKGAGLHVVYTAGRTTWDTGKLEGLAVALPQILELRRIGQPSASIRSAK